MFTSSPHFYVFSAVWHGDNQTPQTISVPFHFKLSAANLQHSNLFAQTCTHTHAHKHTFFFRQRGQLLFDPLWGLSAKPKCQHLLLTDSVSSNNPVTVHILKHGDQQVTAVDLGHNRKSKEYEIYWGIGEWKSETRPECQAGIMPTLCNLKIIFLSILTICPHKIGFLNQKLCILKMLFGVDTSEYRHRQHWPVMLTR